MNKNFLKSVVAGVVSLGLVSSCTHTGAKNESHKCGASKKEDNKCTSNACASAKSGEVKKAKKAKKPVAATTATTTTTTTTAPAVAKAK